MKKVFYTIIAVFIYQMIQAQNDKIEKAVYSTQIGILGIWINGEYRLFDNISLKSEFGMITGIKGCTGCNTEYVLTPEITAEPRWYYNLKKRNSKGKTTKNNSANFIGFGVSYYPDWFVISNNTNNYVPNQLTLIPKWGIKRSISNSNFNYELGIGIGKRYYFNSNQWDSAADLLVRVGYTFK